MSDSRTGKSRSTPRQRPWRRWEMGELPSASAAVQSPGPQQENPQRERARLVEQARREGHEKGRREGHEEGYQAGLETARREGHAEGLEEGQREAREAMRAAAEEALAPLASLVRSTEQALHELDGDIATELVELALAVGRQLACDALKSQPRRVLNIVRELLHGDPLLSDKPRLLMHPRDLELVREHLGQEIEAAGWQLRPDDELSRGGCRLASASGEIDATWEARCEAAFRQARKRRRGSGAKPRESSE